MRLNSGQSGTMFKRTPLRGRHGREFLCAGRPRSLYRRVSGTVALAGVPRVMAYWSLRIDASSRPISGYAAPHATFATQGDSLKPV